jgi:hypothetical protein
MISSINSKIGVLEWLLMGSIKLEVSTAIFYTESMENPITGAIQTGVTARGGEHAYEDNQEVIELTFQGYNCTYVQVITLEAAQELKKQLEFLL